MMSTLCLTCASNIKGCVGTHLGFYFHQFPRHNVHEEVVHVRGSDSFGDIATLRWRENGDIIKNPRWYHKWFSVSKDRFKCTCMPFLLPASAQHQALSVKSIMRSSQALATMTGTSAVMGCRIRHDFRLGLILFSLFLTFLEMRDWMEGPLLTWFSHSDRRFLLILEKGRGISFSLSVVSSIRMHEKDSGPSYFPNNNIG